MNSEETETHPMNKLNHQITTAQTENMSNYKLLDVPMYKHTEVQRPEPIIPPTYEVRKKNAHQKKQENYDKLLSKAL